MGARAASPGGAGKPPLSVNRKLVQYGSAPPTGPPPPSASSRGGGLRPPTGATVWGPSALGQRTFVATVAVHAASVTPRRVDAQRQSPQRTRRTRPRSGARVQKSTWPPVPLPLVKELPHAGARERGYGLKTPRWTPAGAERSCSLPSSGRSSLEPQGRMLQATGRSPYKYVQAGFRPTEAHLPYQFEIFS